MVPEGHYTGRGRLFQWHTFKLGEVIRISVRSFHIHVISQCSSCCKTTNQERRQERGGKGGAKKRRRDETRRDEKGREETRRDERRDEPRRAETRWEGKRRKEKRREEKRREEKSQEERRGEERRGEERREVKVGFPAKRNKTAVLFIHLNEPMVWSTAGPVLEDGVPPRSRFQSKLPLLVSFQPHCPAKQQVNKWLAPQQTNQDMYNVST